VRVREDVAGRRFDTDDRDQRRGARDAEGLLTKVKARGTVGLQGCCSGEKGNAGGGGIYEAEIFGSLPGPKHQWRKRDARGTLPEAE